MSTIAVIYAVLGIGALILSLFIGPHYRAVGVANLRNIFILGFCYFQFYGVIYPLWTGDFGVYSMLVGDFAAGRFIVYSFLFLVAFFWAYNWYLRRRLGKHKPPMFQADYPPVPLLAIALTVALVAYFARFSGAVPLIGPLLNHIFNASAALSACLAVFIIVRNLTNPVFTIPGVIIILLGVFNTILADFSRRGLVGILGGCIWGLYFARPETFKNKTIWLKVLPFVLVAMMIVGAFSNVRTERDTAGQGSLRVQGIVQGINLDAAFSLFAVPDTGMATLWLIDSRREDFAYDHIFAVRYFFLHLVPRQLLPDKAEPLSRRIPVENGTKGVAHGLHTVGPGIVGHAAADGGFYAAVVYGLLIGLSIGWLDGVLATNPKSPLAVAILGSGIGQVLGLSRGDSSIFLGIIFMGTVGNLMVFYFIDLLTRASFPMPSLLPQNQAYGQRLPQPYGSMRNV